MKAPCSFTTARDLSAATQCFNSAKSLRNRWFALSLGVATAGGSLLGLNVASAATITKANNANNLNFSTGWVGGVVPGPLDVALWDGTVTGANSTALGADLSWLGIAIANPGGTVAIGGANTLTLGVGGIDMSAATQDLTVGSNLTIGTGNQAWNVAAGRTLTLNTGTFTRAVGATLNLPGAGAVAASMTGLVNEGTTGILGPWATAGTGANTTYATLSNGNLISYTAGTNVSAAALPNPGTANDNYNLTTASTTTYGAASRTANTIRNTVGASTLTFGNSASQINLVVNGILNAGTGLLTLTNGGSNTSSGIQIGTNNNRELAVNAANAGITLGRIIDNAAGASSVTVNGSGANAVTLTGANTFTGGLNLNSGILQIGSNTAAGTGTLTINGGNIRATGAARTLANAVVVNNSFILGRTTNFSGAVTLNNDITVTSANPDVAAFATSAISGAISGARRLTFTEGANPIGAIILGGANTYTGGTAVNAGIVQFANTAAMPAAGTVAVSAGATLAVNAGGTNEFTDATSGAGSIGGIFGGVGGQGAPITLAAGSFVGIDTTNAGGTFGYGGNITNPNIGLTKLGTGILVLFGANAYTGPTSVLNGTLSVQSLNRVAGGAASSNLGAPTTAANGAINLGAGATAGTLSYIGAGETTDRIINLAGTTGGGVIDQSGNALLRFTGNVTATGVGVKVLTLQGSAPGEIAGVIADNGGTNTTGVTKLGSNTWTLSGANTYTGPTAFGAASSGTLVLANVNALGGGSTLNFGAFSGNAVDIATDGGDRAFPVNSNTGFNATILSNRATAGAGLNHALGAATLGGGTLNVQAGANVTGGAASLTLASVGLTSGTAGAVTTLNPTTATLSVGAVSITSSAAAKNLTLGGTSVGNVVTGVISNGLSALSLTKSDTGSWTLSGANTFTGGTTVSLGLLTVTPGATLGAGNVTVADVTSAALNLQSTVSFADSAILTFGNNSKISLNFSNVPDQLAVITDSTTAFSIAPGTYNASQLNTAFGGIAVFDGLGSLTVAPVPEPSVWAAMSAGFVLLAGTRRARRRAVK